MLKKNPKWIELDADREYLQRMLSTRQRDGGLIAELNAVLAELATVPMMIDKRKVAKVAKVRTPKADKPPKPHKPLTIHDLRPPRAMRNYKAILTDTSSGEELKWKLVFSRIPRCPKNKHWEPIVK